jgi:hypothetical protein
MLPLHSITINTLEEEVENPRWLVAAESNLEELRANFLISAEALRILPSCSIPLVYQSCQLEALLNCIAAFLEHTTIRIERTRNDFEPGGLELRSGSLFYFLSIETKRR